ncbi:HAD-IA family hydrolase [Kineococcus sp. R8]|uniref:HAD family hydrolase n=1 Tax=Kineococcus siccus TaxID=2696567 RepID=UPI0014120609|nr:HAD family hydrolase [Kineococcus siccus]NAZ81638.1 HAD-IA family hydrolase [Kineococcus siccus]
MRAVVVDLDGTLFDHPGASRDGLREWTSGLGVTLTPALSDAWARAEDRHHRAWREGRVPFDEHRRRRLREFLPLAGLPVGDDARLDELFAAGYLTAYRRHWRGYDDVEAGLTAVADAGLRIALLTNGMPEQQHAKLAALGLSGRVGPVLTAGGLGVAKPRREAFAAACAAVGTPASATLHLGDDHPVDVAGARAAGLRAVHLDRTGTGPPGETERLASLHELATYLDTARLRR